MPKPHFPTAVITVSKDEITLPENSIDVNASLSTDPDKHGVISKWEWSGVGVVFSTPNAISSKATFSGVGKPTINLVVYDHAGHKSDMVSKTITVKPAPVPPQITLGANIIIQQPENKVTISASITDPLPITSMRWNIINGSGEIISPTEQTTDVINLKVGLSTLKFSATNSAGLSSEEEMTILEKPYPTVFGAKLQSDQNQTQIDAANLLGLKSIRPSAIAMDTYSGIPKSVINFFNAGLIPLWNVTWTNTGGSNIVDYVSGSDFVVYKARFTQLCKDLVAFRATLSPELQAIFDQLKLAIENEPINIGYYKGPIEDYIAQLRASVEIAAQYGIKVVSGCVHIVLVQQVKDGNFSDIRARNTKALMDAEKTINVYATNTHDSYKDGYTVADIPAIVKYLSDYTGHPVGNNEISTHGATPEVITEFVGICKAAGYIYVNWWSGDVFNGVMIPGGNSDGDALNKGTILSKNGEAYRDAIK